MEEPRLLTDDEIEDILNSTPSITAATTEISNLINENFRRINFYQLKRIKLKPSKIDDLKRFNINQFYRSLCQPGDPIGIAASEALGVPLTQNNLNTFHQAGYAIDVSIKQYKEAFNASQNRSNERTTIHFKDKNLTREQILMFQKKIKGITINFLSKKSEIFKYNQPEPWYKHYIKRINPEFKPSAYFLRIYFDIKLLHKYTISLHEIIMKLEYFKNGEEKMLDCIPSPLHLGIIDCFTFDNGIQNTLTKFLSPNYNEALDVSTASIIFLNLILRPKLTDYLICGIDKIQDIYPVTLNMGSFILTQEKIVNTSNNWLIRVNFLDLKKKGFPISKFYEIFDLLNWKVKNDFNVDKFFIVKTHNLENIKPFEHILSIINEEKNLIRNSQTQPSNIFKSYHYVYIEAIGSNLKEILSLPFIDESCTICNNYNEILKCFGIETTRNYIANDIYSMIQSGGSNIDPRYIFLIADYITCAGNLTPISSKGISKLGSRSGLANASFQEPIIHMVNDAISGKTHKATDTSISVLFGKRIMMGSGFVKVSLVENIMQYLENIQKPIVQLNEEIKIEESEILPNEQGFSIETPQEEKPIFKVFNIDKLKIKNGPPKGPIPEVKGQINKLPKVLITKFFKIIKSHLPPIGDLTFDDLLNNYFETKAKPQDKIKLSKISILKKYI